jgi:type IV pilus assembly protein PilE
MAGEYTPIAADAAPTSSGQATDPASGSVEAAAGAGAADRADRQEAGRPSSLTLVEVMATFAVIATFVLVAYPAYVGFLRETGRGDAYAALLDLATREETHYNRYNRYTDVIVAPPGCAGARCGLRARDSSPEGNYELSVGAGRTGDLATSFVLTAKAKPGRRQESDEGCEVLTINWLGETRPPECW